METVIIETEKGDCDECLYRPKDSTDKDGKLRFYAETENGWRVVTLETVQPEKSIFVDDSGRVVDSPFSDSPPKEISPCRLLPPPIYESEEIAEKFTPENPPELLPDFPESKWGWKRLYRKIHGEALWVKPEHEGEPRGAHGTRKGGPIRDILAKIKWTAHAEHRREVRQWESELRRFEELTLEDLKIGTEKQRQEQLKDKGERLNDCRNYWHSFKELNLEEFKRGFYPGEGTSPRDSYLVGEWAKKKGIDRKVMEKDAETCRIWIMSHCRNATGHVVNSGSGMKKPILYITRGDMIKEVLVKVRYKVRFQNEIVLFLTGCEERELSYDELTEVNTLVAEKSFQSTDQYCIRRTGSAYEITFDGEKFTAKHSRGIAFIVAFIRNSGKNIPLQEIFKEAFGTSDQITPNLEVKQKTDFSNMGVSETRDQEQARRAIKVMQKEMTRYLELEKYSESGEGLEKMERLEFECLKDKIGVVEEVEKEVARLSKVASGSQSFLEGESKKIRNTIRVAIKRALAEITEFKVPPVSPSSQKASKGFCEHISRYLVKHNLNYYEPPPGITWNLSS